MTKGKCVVLSAPSGSGKTTLAKRLLQNTSLPLAFRFRQLLVNPEQTKKMGLVIFLSNEVFQEQIDEGSFWSTKRFIQGFYGTLQAEVERLWSEGKHVIFDIDVDGGLQIKKQFPDQTITIFIMPPSLEALKERLTNRDTESTESLKMRLSKAKNEMKSASKFEHIIHNDDLNKAEQELQALVTRFIEI